MMWGWDPQWPKQWEPNLGCSVVPKGRTPNSLCIGIPNGQSNGSQTWGALWFRRAGPQTHVGLGTPMAKGVDPKVMWGWDPQWPKQWDPNLGCSVVPKGRTPNSCGVGIPNGQSDGTPTWGVPRSIMARSQTWGVLGSPLTPWMDPHCIGICNVGVHLGSPMAKAMGPQLGVLCGSEGPDPKMMWGWDPQWPKQWDPHLGCSVVPKGRTPNSYRVRIPIDQRGGPQIHCALGSPMAKAMGPQFGVSRGPSWPDPKLGVCWDPH